MQVLKEVWYNIAKMPKDEIIQSLKAALKELGLGDFEPVLERPKDGSHGDFSSNVAMAAFNKIGGPVSLHPRPMSSEDKLPAGTRRGSPALATLDFNSPLDLAEKIVEILNSKFLIHNSNFDRVEIAKPGFINFYLSNEYLQNQIQNIIKQGDNYGSLTLGKGKKASVEFVSANPTGPLHIGNAVGGPLGDTIANALAKAGYSVKREYLHNNVGGQVSKLGEAIYFELNPDKKSKDEETQYQGEYIKELAQKVSKSLNVSQLSREEFIEKAASNAVSIILEEILKDCKDMGIKFDIVRKESDLRQEVPDALSKIQKFLKEKDGARWFAPADEFLKDRETVVKKSDGEFTYFASDIAYHNEKMSKNNLVIDILGSNHSGHVPRLQAVVKALGFDVNNFKVILYQYVRLKRGSEIVKMSKRAGNFVTAREVLDEVGKDAFRFFLLRSAPETHMDFDLDLAKKQASENPVFYVQYAYTRICSIFTKVKNQKSKVKSNDFGSADVSLLTEAEEVALIRHLLKFPELIEEVSRTFGVHAFTTYAMELATFFHKFYEAHRVISENDKQTNARLALLKTTQITLKNTLGLLGVSAPEKM
ncbi:MAG: arginine--tRNA ligase [Patescibacteria group bacterium]|nr:arginine--tRNA ligase [Patescibacteria group bacterium]